MERSAESDNEYSSSINGEEYTDKLSKLLASQEGPRLIELVDYASYVLIFNLLFYVQFSVNSITASQFLSLPVIKRYLMKKAQK